MTRTSAAILSGPGSASLLLVAAVVLAATGETARSAEAQVRCSTLSISSGFSYTVPAANGDLVVFHQRGLEVRCPERGIIITADSGHYVESRRTVTLTGRAVYRERSSRITSDTMIYIEPADQIIVRGHVNARMSDGTSMTGPVLQYWRANPALGREANQMEATGNPIFAIVEVDSGNGTADTTNVTARRVWMDGDITVAHGGVTIERPDLTATGDSLYIDKSIELLRLMLEPRMTGKGERPFTLVGKVIDVFTTDRRLSRVLAQDDARVDSDEIQLVADTVDLRMEEDLLQHAYAWGPSRARAISEGQFMEADSIEIDLPQQRLREVRAVGDAVAELQPDSVRFDSDLRDFVRGDTVIAQFVQLRRNLPAVLRDTTAADSVQTGADAVRSALDRLVAIGAASTLYQLPPASPDSRCPQIGYLRGVRLEISMLEGKLQTARVVGGGGVPSDGVMLQCTGDTLSVHAGVPARMPMRPRR